MRTDFVADDFAVEYSAVNLMPTSALSSVHDETSNAREIIITDLIKNSVFIIINFNFYLAFIIEDVGLSKGCNRNEKKSI
jgi:hypothetical protein